MNEERPPNLNELDPISPHPVTKQLPSECQIDQDGYLVCNNILRSHHPILYRSGADIVIGDSGLYFLEQKSKYQGTNPFFYNLVSFNEKDHRMSREKKAKSVSEHCYRQVDNYLFYFERNKVTSSNNLMAIHLPSGLEMTIANKYKNCKALGSMHLELSNPNKKGSIYSNDQLLQAAEEQIKKRAQKPSSQALTRLPSFIKDRRQSSITDSSSQNSLPATLEQ